MFAAPPFRGIRVNVFTERRKSAVSSMIVSLLFLFIAGDRSASV
jgi:hypothetical protein